MMDLLELRQVSANPWGELLLSDINISVQSGEIHGLIGTNGAGKSTLLRCMSGEISTSAGTVALAGTDIADLSGLERARQLALLPQQSLLNFPFTVEEVVALGRIPHATGFEVDQQVVVEAMQATDVSAMSGKLYTQLSGGEKQRVQLARIFSQIWSLDDGGHKLLLLDELNNGLDLGHQQMLAEQLRKLAAKGCGIVLVLHDFNVVSGLAHQITALHKGSVAAQGSPSEVLTQELFQEVFASNVDIVAHPRHSHPVVIQS